MKILLLYLLYEYMLNFNFALTNIIQYTAFISTLYNISHYNLPLCTMIFTSYFSSIGTSLYTPSSMVPFFHVVNRQTIFSS